MAKGLWDGMKMLNKFIQKWDNTKESGNMIDNMVKASIRIKRATLGKANGKTV